MTPLAVGRSTDGWNWCGSECLWVANSQCEAIRTRHAVLHVPAVLRGAIAPGCGWRASGRILDRALCRDALMLRARVVSLSDGRSRHFRRGDFMNTSTLRSIGALGAGLAVLLMVGPARVFGATPAVPDPCGLVTVAEVTQIAGPLEGAPRKGDIAAGDVSCEYTVKKSGQWITVMLAEGDLDYWRKRNGGPRPVMLPDLGKGAFFNPDFYGSAEVYAQKGKLVVRVSAPTGPGALEIVKAITRKVLAHP